jgi:hypothetical protein
MITCIRLFIMCAFWRATLATCTAQEASTFTDLGGDNGWCASSLNYNVGNADDIGQCWDSCYAIYGAALMAADLSEVGGSCWCQDSCPCMEYGGHGGLAISTSIYYIPDICESEPVFSVFNDYMSWDDAQL